MEQVAAIRSREEIESAIGAFTSADWARLYKVAQARIRYSSFPRHIEPRDLIQEAIVRALTSRSCPADVDVVRFIAEAIRSIGHAELEKAQSRPVIASNVRSDDPQAPFPDPSISPEEAVIDRETTATLRRKILVLFEDDPQTRDFVEAIMEELNAAELREMFNLNQTAYDSKRRLIRRRINKAYSEGWKP